MTELTMHLVRTASKRQQQDSAPAFQVRVELLSWNSKSNTRSFNTLAIHKHISETKGQ
ncbi:hypothetical protein K1T71_003189 [Dendrolimus kikuchii]|uniref:Uncharacterized protein n=1 Tax=Dendrolimus kikuchii TaxID=765133 RepID=A0ACC1DBH9_9NEOP|nr:hypothetical protein K1T71_003189 [Dendrolimus kikuchii]